MPFAYSTLPCVARNIPRSRFWSPSRPRRTRGRPEAMRELRSHSHAVQAWRYRHPSTVWRDRQQTDGKRADLRIPGKRLTSVFHILMIASAAVSKMESSGDHAKHETGSACSRKIYSSVKPDCVRFEKGWALATSSSLTCGSRYRGLTLTFHNMTVRSFPAVASHSPLWLHSSLHTSSE